MIIFIDNHFAVLQCVFHCVYILHFACMHVCVCPVLFACFVLCWCFLCVCFALCVKDMVELPAEGQQLEEELRQIVDYTQGSSLARFRMTRKSTLDVI